MLTKKIAKVENITFSGDYSNFSSLIYFYQEIGNENSLFQIKNINFQDVENVQYLVDTSCSQIEISFIKINSSILNGGFNILSNIFKFNEIKINNSTLNTALNQDSFEDGLTTVSMNYVYITNSVIGQLEKNMENFNMVGNVSVTNFHYETEENMGNCVLSCGSLTDFDRFYLSDSSFDFGPWITFDDNSNPFCSSGL